MADKNGRRLNVGVQTDTNGSIFKLPNVYLSHSFFFIFFSFSNKMSDSSEYEYVSGSDDSEESASYPAKVLMMCGTIASLKELKTYHLIQRYKGHLRNPQSQEPRMVSLTNMSENYNEEIAYTTAKALHVDVGVKLEHVESLVSLKSLQDHLKVWGQGDERHDKYHIMVDEFCPAVCEDNLNQTNLILRKEIGKIVTKYLAPNGYYITFVTTKTKRHGVEEDIPPEFQKRYVGCLKGMGLRLVHEEEVWNLKGTNIQIYQKTGATTRKHKAVTRGRILKDVKEYKRILSRITSKYGTADEQTRKVFLREMAKIHVK
jgi:hypothetical protein